MKLALIADEIGHNMSRQLSAALSRMGFKHNYLDVSVLSIKPCIACASCSGKTFGRCVQKDDMEKVYRAIAQSDHWVLLSSLRFGGLSSKAKRVLDRSGTLGDAHYYYQDRELVKGRKSKTRTYSAVGVKFACSEKEKMPFCICTKKIHAS